MKHRIKKHLSLIIALSMLLSLIPFYGAAVDDEFAGYETLEEIPFEFELEPGDLPFEQLENATLAPEDIPSCIDPALAEARGHVNRLYLQEPDDYTVMFQNRDGSKTIYVFSHPVKGMTASMTAAIQVNGSVVSFTGTNAITSRIAELSDYNIGYSEVAYIPTGILSADGIDLTEDARGWARGESMPSALSYNISSEAAAEYAASVSVPNTDVATAAVAPGVTITPNDPAPLGGMTVMSISYSTLAGLMSFQNAATEQYLTMRTSATNPLLVNDNIVVPFSRWIVSYDSTYGYTVTNLYQPSNYYLGLDDNDALAVTSLNNLTAAFTIAIVSTADSKVTISFGNKAIDSTASVYSNDPSAASFPTSCEWIINTKTDCNLVESITPTSNVRTVNSGAIFYGEYTTAPTAPTYSDIELYFASNDQIVSSDSDYDLPDSTAYCISALGSYAVYYKDNCTGVKSANFTLNVVEYVTEIGVPSSVRVEQKGVGFELDYSFTPPTSTYYSISLYYADTNTEVSHTGDTYTIPTAGVYSVYYKDSVSGVTSECFALVIVDSMPASDNNLTYTIQPINNSGLYLTMEANTTTINGDTVYKAETNDIFLTSMSTGAYEKLDDISRTFVIEQYAYGFNISATLPTLQYLGVPDGSSINNVSTYNPDYEVDYTLTKLTDQNNALNYSEGVVSTKNYSADGSVLGLFPITVSDAGENEYYYIIVCGASDDGVLALKYNSSTNYSVEVYTPGQNGFVWKFTQAGVNAPLIKQTTNFWCGYTTVLQALYGKNCDVSNFGDTLHQQIEYIAVASTHPNEMAYKFWLDEDINTTLPSFGQNYDNAEGNVPSYDNAKQIIRNSLNNGWTPFFLTNTAGIPYRRTGNGAHYICIVGYDSQSDCVIISNCHFSNQVFGIYTIPYQQFYQAISCLYWQE